MANSSNLVLVATMVPGDSAGLSDPNGTHGSMVLSCNMVLDSDLDPKQSHSF